MSGLSPEVLEEATAALRAGEVIGLPTETVYGVGVLPYLPDATQRLFAVKQRPETTPLPVLIADAERASELAVLDERAEAIIAAFWPGPLTVVLPRRLGVRLYLGGDGATVGLRCPDQPITRELLARVGPLAVTSANLHGMAPARSAAELRQSLGSGVRLIVDGGRCEGEPSTVVSLVGSDVTFLREGALSPSEILSRL